MYLPSWSLIKFSLNKTQFLRRISLFNNLIVLLFSLLLAFGRHLEHIGAKVQLPAGCRWANLFSEVLQHGLDTHSSCSNKHLDQAKFSSQFGAGWNTQRMQLPTRLWVWDVVWPILGWLWRRWRGENGGLVWFGGSQTAGDQPTRPGSLVTVPSNRAFAITHALQLRPSQVNGGSNNNPEIARQWS